MASRDSIHLSGPVHAEILDPCLGQRWELARDPDHPTGPWRMVLVETKMEGKSVADWLSRAGPVIRSGDRVIVEQRTAVLEARFSAVALTSAPLGAKLRVRLTTGRSPAGVDGYSSAIGVDGRNNLPGPIFEVRATGKGLAVFEGEPTSAARPVVEEMRP